jgi:DNA polymerase III delta prime subunit
MNATWATKYRPDTPDELVGSARDIYHAFDNIQHAIIHSREAGTGKTTFAHVVAKERGWPIHVFNASSKKTRGIAFVEEELLPLTRMGMNEQIILLDEADQLTMEAQSALKGVIENSQGYFILTCNDLSKISPWLRSRCLDIPFYPVPKQDIIDRLAVICGSESVNITMSQLALIADAHPGDLRNCINALQACLYLSSCPHAENLLFLSLDLSLPSLRRSIGSMGNRVSYLSFVILNSIGCLSLFSMPLILLIRAANWLKCMVCLV